MYLKLFVLCLGSPNSFTNLLNVDNVSHIYEIILLYFLHLAAAIMQNWADGHENHLLIVIAFLSICAESCLRIRKKFLKMP